MKHISKFKAERLYKLYGKCTFTWEDKKNEDHNHTCKRIKGHPLSTGHRCECGTVCRKADVRDFRNVTNSIGGRKGCT